MEIFLAAFFGIALGTYATYQCCIYLELKDIREYRRVTENRFEYLQNIMNRNSVSMQSALGRLQSEICTLQQRLDSLGTERHYIQ